ncbi:hypothetical protein B9T16_17255 [Arthrospira sp. PCC 8006]
MFRLGGGYGSNFKTHRGSQIISEILRSLLTTNKMRSHYLIITPLNSVHYQHNAFQLVTCLGMVATTHIILDNCFTSDIGYPHNPQQVSNFWW